MRPTGNQESGLPVIGAGGMLGSLVGFWWTVQQIDASEGDLGPLLARQVVVVAVLVMIAAAVRRVRLFAVGAALGLVVGFFIAVVVALLLLGSSVGS